MDRFQPNGSPEVGFSEDACRQESLGYPIAAGLVRQIPLCVSLSVQGLPFSGNVRPCLQRPRRGAPAFHRNAPLHFHRMPIYPRREDREGVRLGRGSTIPQRLRQPGHQRSELFSMREMLPYAFNPRTARQAGTFSRRLRYRQVRTVRGAFLSKCLASQDDSFCKEIAGLWREKNGA